MWIRAWRVSTGLALNLALACAETPSVPAPGVITPAPSPVIPTSTPTPTDDALEGGQTGSGGVPIGFSCQQVPSSACGPSLLAAFAKAETPLESAGSLCVPASEVDPTLDAVPVCQCSFTRSTYFSDIAGSRSKRAFTVGLAQRRAALGQGGDSCDVRFMDECVLEGAAFAGCSLDTAESSCEATCGQLSRRYSNVVAQSKALVEVLTAECVPCAVVAGLCLGILRVGEHCFSAAQESLNYDYTPRSLPCDATPEQALQAEVDAYSYRSNCTIARPDPLVCEGDAGAACTPDAGGLLVAPGDASTADASTTNAASTDASTTDAASAP